MRGDVLAPVIIISGLLLASLTGCKKADPAVSAAQVQVIDASHFRPAFASAKPETQTLVDNVMLSIQSSDFAKALSNLEKLGALEDLTPAQKQAVNEVTAQVQKKLTPVSTENR